MPTSLDKATKPKPKKEKNREKSSKHKTAKDSKKTSKPSALSQERIVDSESEEETTAPKSTAKTASKANSPRKSAKQSEPRAKQTPVAAAPPQQVSSPSSSSEDDEDDSSGENKEGSLRKPDLKPVKVNGVKRKVSTVGTEGREEPPVKKSKTAGHPTQEESSSEEDSSDDDSDESIPQIRTAKGSKSQPIPAPAPALKTSSISATPFDPPEGFASIANTNAAGKSMFTSMSLAGKELWLLSAPSNVPIESIEEVAMQSIQDGRAVLRHKGAEYMLAEDKDRKLQFHSILVPEQSGYQIADVKVQRALKLQQKLVLPNLSKLQSDPQTGSKAAADVARAAVSTVRPQPQGLRMRYRPPGFGHGDPGLGSESEDDQSRSRSSLQFPESLGVHGANEESSGKPSKKKDKKKRSMDVEKMVNGEGSLPSTLSVKKAKHKETKTLDEAQRPGTAASLESAEVEREETKEERRERKRIKKEQKLKAQKT